ncbi:MAG: imidazole glycerol phosphate synthase subunit HisF [Mycobacteriales bacterium]
MTSARVIACLDVSNGRVVKGTHFRELRDMGDPVELARRYEQEGIDEIVFLDVSATPEGRGSVLALAERAAGEVFIPLTVGGGIRCVEDIGRALRAGADKVAINTAAVDHPELIDAASSRFGAQCIVISIDARTTGRGFTVWTRSGSVDSGRTLIDWARECERRGAGELLVTSIDRDGTGLGYDIEQLRQVAEAVGLPVVASGGAGGVADVVEVFDRTPVSAALVAGILHVSAVSVAGIKAALVEANLCVRGMA